MFKRMSLSRKLAISNLLYAIPVVVLISMLFFARNADIKFAELELMGNYYEKPLNTLLEHVSRHKLVAQRALSGDASARGLLAGIESQVDSDLNAVSVADQEWGKTLLFTDEELRKRKEENFRYSKLASQWSDIKGKMGSFKSSDSNDAHTTMIANIRGMITHLGNSSNLILDPELDSYYLTDATLGGLPSD